MSERKKLLAQVLSGRSDNNIHFDSLCRLLVSLGFEKRIRGDHYIFTRNGIDEILNIQPLGNQAKSYQIKQIRTIIIRYKLGGEDADQV